MKNKTKFSKNIISFSHKKVNRKIKKNGGFSPFRELVMSIDISFKKDNPRGK